MDEALKLLQEKRQQIAADMRKHAENQANWTAEDRAKWDALNTAYDENMAALTDRRRVVEKQDADRKAMQDRLDQLGGYQDYAPPARPRFGQDGGTLDAGPRSQGVFGAARPPSAQSMALHAWMMAGVPELRNRITDQHRQAVTQVGAHLDSDTFVLNLRNTNDARQLQASHPYHYGHREGVARNAMKVGDPDTGGFMVVPTMADVIERAMLDFSGVLQVAEIVRTSTGEPIVFITADDTSNTGSRVGESQDAGSANDPLIGQQRLSSYTFTSGLLNVSRTLLRDSVQNVEEMVGQMLGERLGRKQNTDYTTGGGGGNSPQGCVTGAAAGVTAASATATTWDEIIDLEHSVDPSRRSLPSVGYMLHDSILKAYRKLKDGNGQPIWQVGWNSGAPDTLNKRPYWINQAMASAMVSGAKTLLFGQMDMIKVRQVGTVVIQRLKERRAEYDQDAFIAYAYGDSIVLNPGDGPIRCLAHP